MSQQTPIIGSSQSGIEYRTQDNNGKQALLNHHKGSTVPTYAEAGCIWLDDTATPWLLKIHDGTDWITLAEVNATTNKVNALNHSTDITDKTSATIASGDKLVFADASDSDNLKSDTVQGIISAGASVALEYSKTQNFNATTLTDAATIAWDTESNQVASVTLAGDRTLGAPTNLVDGATYILTVKQDATGSRTLAYNAVFKFAGGTAPTLSTGVNAVDVLTFVSDGTNMYGVSQLGFV